VTHTYTTTGVWTIDLIVTDSRSVLPDPIGTAMGGATWSRYQAQFVTVNPLLGYVSGNVYALAVNTGEVSAPAGSTCWQSWIIKGASSAPVDPTSETSSVTYSDITGCDGYAHFLFNSQFLEGDDGDTLIARGNGILNWPYCAGLTFQSVNVSHLTLFADGQSALLTGFGIYSALPSLGPLPFTIYAVDSSPDSFHFRLSDNSGVVLFDTDPCMPPITDITVQPQLPNSVISTGSVLNPVKIYNPTGEEISALLGDSSSAGGVATGITVGALLGIVFGIAGLVVIISVVIYFLVKSGQFSSLTPKGERFVKMM